MLRQRQCSCMSNLKINKVDVGDDDCSFRCTLHGRRIGWTLGMDGNNGTGYVSTTRQCERTRKVNTRGYRQQKKKGQNEQEAVRRTKQELTTKQNNTRVASGQWPESRTTKDSTHKGRTNHNKLDHARHMIEQESHATPCQAGKPKSQPWQQGAAMERRVQRAKGPLRRTYARVLMNGRQKQKQKQKQKQREPGIEQEGKCTERGPNHTDKSAPNTQKRGDP